MGGDIVPRLWSAAKTTKDVAVAPVLGLMQVRSPLGPTNTESSGGHRRHDTGLFRRWMTCGSPSSAAMTAVSSIGSVLQRAVSPGRFSSSSTPVVSGIGSASSSSSASRSSSTSFLYSRFAEFLSPIAV